MSGHIGSAGNLHWNTPHKIRDGVHAVFGGPPGLDPCSNETSVMGAKENYLLPHNDGLTDPWNINGIGTTVFVNPPFGKSYMKPDRSDIIGAKTYQALKKADQENGTTLADEYSVHTSIQDWTRRCSNEHNMNGVESIALLPAATDTRGHWQKIIFPTAHSICFIAGRLSFLMPDGKPGGACPMAMALAYWGDNLEEFTGVFKKLGTIR